MLDKKRIEEKIKTIQRERTLLEDFMDITFKDFIAVESIHEYYGAIHHLQVALQAVLDIAQHIVAQKLLGTYKQNSEVFNILANNKIISKELSEIMEKAMGTRNILVHQYEDVDPQEIFNIIQHNLNDFDQFIIEIDKFLSVKNI